MPTLFLAAITIFGGGGFVPPQAPPMIETVTITETVIETVVITESPCYEDEVAMVQHHTFEPAADDRGFWDGDRYYRLCVPLDNLIAEWESAAEERGFDVGYDAGSWEGYEYGYEEGYAAGLVAS